MDTAGNLQAGVGLFDCETIAGDTRLIGNISIEATLPAIGSKSSTQTTIAGFENHAGRTLLGEHAKPLGTVLYGLGNDGTGQFEGCIKQYAIGTYLHGPLLPRNPALADWLLVAAAHHAGTTSEIVDRFYDSTLVPTVLTTIASAAQKVSIDRSKQDAKRRH